MKTIKYFSLFAFLFSLLSTAFAEQLPSPQLLSPTLGATLSANAQPKFDWSDVSLANTYRIQVAPGQIQTSADGTTCTNCLINEKLSPTEYQATQPLATGNYTWRVRAGHTTDPTLPASEWAVGNFAVRLPTPQLVSPSQAEKLASVTPTLDWNDVPKASTYRLQVAEVASFQTSADGQDCYNCKINYKSAATSQYVVQTTDGLQLTKTYYWRVRAGSDTLVESVWSEVRSFTLESQTTSTPTTPTPATTPPATGTSTTPPSTGTVETTPPPVVAVPTNSPPEYQAGSATPTVTQGGNVTFKSSWKDVENNYIVNVRVKYCRESTNLDCQELSLDWVAGSNPPQFVKTMSIPADMVLGRYKYQFQAADVLNFNESPLHVTEWQTGGVFEVIAPQQKANRPPTLEKVDESITGQLYVVKLKARDPDGNLQSIDIDWTGKGGKDGQVENRLVADGEVVTFTHTYQTTKATTWTATAYDTLNANSKIVWGREREKEAQRQQAAKKRALSNNGNKLLVMCPKADGSCGLVADPIDTASGAQLIDYTLLTADGVLPISFSLSYNSLLLAEGVAGKGWDDGQLRAYLIELSNGDVQIYWTENAFNQFTKDSQGQFISGQPVTHFDKLVKNADGGFTLTRANHTVYQFNADGQLVKLGNRLGQVLTFSYDPLHGHLLKVTEPVSGVFLSYAYNSVGLLDTVTDPLGRKVQFNYDADHHLLSITDAAGQTTTFTYNENGQILTATDAQGVSLFSNTYDADGRVVAQDDGVSGNLPLKLVYDETSQPGKLLTTVFDRMGETSVYTYDENANLLSVKDELGHTTSYSYNVNGQLLSITDAKGRQSFWSYDDQSNLMAVHDAAGHATHFSYDADNLLIAIEDTLGKQTTFTYDNQRLTSVTDPLGNVTRYTYTPEGLLHTLTSPRGQVTTYQYDNGWPIQETDAAGNSQKFSFDAAGRLLSVTDAEGHTATFSYDATNQLVAVQDALGRRVQLAYDAQGHLVTVTDAKGHVTQRTYNGNGKLLSHKNALGQETRYEYDGEDRLVKILDAKGQVTQLGYDAKGRLLSVTDTLGNQQQLTYDAADNLLKQIDALGNTVATLTYNAVNRPLSVTDTLGNTARFEYDAVNRLTRILNPLTQVTQFQYDEVNRITGSQDANGGHSSQTFDADGHLTSLQDPNSHTTTFQFDSNGRLVEEATAAGDKVSYTYNARDLLVALTNARGQARQLEYDAVGRLTRLTDLDGTITYTYDENDNLLTVTDANGTITRDYDALGRVLKYTNSQGQTLQYAYDAVGHLVSLSYPDGKVVRYDYDAIDQLIKVTDWAGRETRYGYDTNGRLLQTLRPNGTQQTRRYNAAGALVQQQEMTAAGILVSQFDFLYDAAGNIRAEQVLPDPTEPLPVQPVTMTYTAANRLATFNGKAVGFDADANLTTGPLNGELDEFSYDSRNRLVGVGKHTVYRYDAENQRLAVSIAGQETRYVTNPQAALSQVLMKTSPEGKVTFYVYGLGLLGEETDGAYQAYHFDLRGSTVALTDATGKVLERFQYTPYGGLVSHSPAMVKTPFLFNGQYGVMTDATGLYYMRARYYHPEIRRFVNQDVLLGEVAEGQTLNRFAFVTGEPVSYVDPFGLEGVDVCDRPLGGKAEGDMKTGPDISLNPLFHRYLCVEQDGEYKCFGKTASFTSSVAGTPTGKEDYYSSDNCKARPYFGEEAKTMVSCIVKEGNNDDRGNYNIIWNNCQQWVASVLETCEIEVRGDTLEQFETEINRYANMSTEELQDILNGLGAF
jgi:RHS repeat-associated protein